MHVGRAKGAVRTSTFALLISLRCGIAPGGIGRIIVNGMDMKGILGFVFTSPQRAIVDQTGLEGATTSTSPTRRKRSAPRRSPSAARAHLMASIRADRRSSPRCRISWG